MILSVKLLYKTCTAVVLITINVERIPQFCKGRQFQFLFLVFKLLETFICLQPDQLKQQQLRQLKGSVIQGGQKTVIAQQLVTSIPQVCQVNMSVCSSLSMRKTISNLGL